MESLYFEDFVEGEEMETGARTVDDALVRSFAEVSGDLNPLHLDEAYARRSVFGERVAHGVLGLAVATGLLNRSGLTRGTLVALAGLSWRFLAPIRLGTSVRLQVRTASVRPTRQPDRGLVVLDGRLVDAEGGVLQEGQLTLLVRRRSAGSGSVGAG